MYCTFVECKCRYQGGLAGGDASLRIFGEVIYFC
jgi:hypothetical protein